MNSSFDLTRNLPEIKTLFVMESPYLEELASGIPCSGGTGKRMAATLFNNDSTALGKLIHEENADALQYGIMNSFPFALGLRKSLPKELQLYTHIKTLKWTNRTDFYQQHLSALDNWPELEKHTEFKKRLNQYINQAPNLKHIVFCGYIAQSMYLHFYKQPILPYNKLYPIKTESGRDIYALFVNHPSERNAVWDLKKEMIEK